MLQGFWLFKLPAQVTKRMLQDEFTIALLYSGLTVNPLISTNVSATCFTSHSMTTFGHFLQLRNSMLET